MYVCVYIYIYILHYVCASKGNRLIDTIVSSLESFSRSNRFQDHRKFSKYLAHDSHDLKGREEKKKRNDTNVVKIRNEERQRNCVVVHNCLETLEEEIFARFFMDFT